MWISLKSHSKEGVLSVGPSSAKSRSQLSLFKTKSSDYVIICVRVPPSRIPVPFLVFDIEIIKALTNEIAPCPTGILTKRINEIDYNRFSWPTYTFTTTHNRWKPAW